MRGDLLTPDQDGFDEARSIWNARPGGRPAAIARCAGVDDVVTAIRWAGTHDLAVSVRGGGHHTTGFAVCDGGLMIDLSQMNDVQVDAAAKTAVVGPGARARDLNRATQPHGLATTAAPIVSCGMSGYTLGGGLGWISRNHGLACDNLLSAEVVTADGRIVTASDEENPELFWALRGGGGNFGIVTSFRFRLHEVGPTVLSGQIVYTMNEAAAALRNYRDFMETAPDELSCMPVFFMMPSAEGIPDEIQGESVLAIVPFYDGDLTKGQDLLRPLTEFGHPAINQMGPDQYQDLLANLEAGMFAAGDRNYYATAFFDELTDDTIDILVDQIAPVPSPFSSLFIEWLGGAGSRVASNATAFPHRDRKLVITAVPKWRDEADDAEMILWATRLFSSLASHAAPGKYVNYLDHPATGPAGARGTNAANAAARAAYGENYDRLAAVKMKWDPRNLLRMNHNISPALGPVETE